MVRFTALVLSLFLFNTLLSGCLYRLPREGEVRAVPTTNNPLLQGKKSTQAPLPEIPFD
jgi:hypothetical protein